MDDLTITAVDVGSPEARRLIARLDEDLDRRYGPAQPQFTAANLLADGSTFLVGTLNDRPVACGALRPVDAATVEIKRMYVEPDLRGRGLARRLLAELEERARLAGYAVARLETGLAQPEAMRLYESAGYRRTDCYGIYADNPDSVCYEKSL